MGFSATGAETSDCTNREFVLLFGSSSGFVVGLLVAWSIGFSVRQ
jgi:hypothetical protein